MNIVFIDPKCPRPYDPEVMSKQGLGGTESTVIRIATALSFEHNVAVIQHNRKERWSTEHRLRFEPASELEHVVSQADHVIFIQKAQDLSKIYRLFRGRIWLWLHNFVPEEVPLFWFDHLRHRLGIICVSKTHALHTLRYISSQKHSWLTAKRVLRGDILYHYNPLKDDLYRKKKIAIDPYKLIFFSSHHKGIEQAINQFEKIRFIEPRLRLYVADPGYIKNFDNNLLESSGITRLGCLPQSEILDHVRESLCVFYPQTKRAETFGLVYAEANAVGTPVLAHDFGAAREILSINNPPIDASSFETVQRTLFQWLGGQRPIVNADPRFSITSVSRGWHEFLANPAEYTCKIV